MNRILKEGQAYVDLPVYAQIKADAVRMGVQMAMGTYKEPRNIKLQNERRELRWMKPVRRRSWRNLFGLLRGGEFARDAQGKVKLVPK